jgi:hypothetical protein
MSVTAKPRCHPTQTQTIRLSIPPHETHLTFQGKSSECSCSIPGRLLAKLPAPPAPSPKNAPNVPGATQAITPQIPGSAQEITSPKLRKLLSQPRTSPRKLRVQPRQSPRESSRVRQARLPAKAPKTAWPPKANSSLKFRKAPLPKRESLRRLLRMQAKFQGFPEPARKIRPRYLNSQTPRIHHGPFRTDGNAVRKIRFPSAKCTLPRPNFMISRLWR